MEIKFENDTRSLRSPGYNYDFDAKTGRFERWGETKDVDPEYSPYGPEILDVEIVTGCRGVRGNLCRYCYKANTTDKVEYMGLERFKEVFSKINENKTVTQVALGLDAGAELNPDTWKISEWLRSEGVVPNGTVADVTPETADKIASLWGACAVSAHLLAPNGWVAFKDSVGLLTDRLGKPGNTLVAVNCHFMLSEQTYDLCKKLVATVSKDPVLSRLYAIVLLGLKQCGRGSRGFKPLPFEKFADVVRYANHKKVGIGFDSCSANKFTRFLKLDLASKTNAAVEAFTGNLAADEAGLKDVLGKLKRWYDDTLQLVEPCESWGLFSSYVNVKGEYFPCSFAEHVVEGIDVLGYESFADVWNSRFVDYGRRLSLASHRGCPIYDVDGDRNEKLLSRLTHTADLDVAEAAFS